MTEVKNKELFQFNTKEPHFSHCCLLEVVLRIQTLTVQQ